MTDNVGDKWEIYIPAEQAYGKLNQPGIPGASTLIFEIVIFIKMISRIFSDN